MPNVFLEAFGLVAPAFTCAIFLGAVCVIDKFLELCRKADLILDRVIEVECKVESLQKLAAPDAKEGQDA